MEEAGRGSWKLSLPVFGCAGGHQWWRAMGTAGISRLPTVSAAVRGGAPPLRLQRLGEVEEVRLDVVVLVVPLICSGRRRGGQISSAERVEA